MRPITRLPLTLVALAGLGILVSAAEGALKIEPLGYVAGVSASMQLAATASSADQRETARQSPSDLPSDGLLLVPAHNSSGAQTVPVESSHGAAEVFLRMARIRIPDPPMVYRYICEGIIEVPDPHPTGLLRPPTPESE
jgi:hypothetical protein